MSDYRQDLQQHAASVLAPGERLLASVRAMPVGPFGGSMGIFAGAAVGALIQAVAISRSVKKARLSGFPIAGRMAIGLTDRRVVVWQRGGFLGGAITKLVGDVPLTRIARIDGEPVPGRSKLTFVLRDARAVTVEADKRDAPHLLAESFNQSAFPGQFPTAVPAPPPPAPVPTQTTPTAPVGFAAPVPAAAGGVVTALAEEDGRACLRCDTRNPSSAEFCWRCFASFARAPQTNMTRPGPGGVLAGTQPLESPPAPAGSWTPPHPPPSWLPAPSVEQSGGWPVAAKIGVAVFAALMVAGAAVIALSRTHHSRISIPDSIGGAQRVVTPASQQAEQQILEGAKRYGVTGKVGFYALGGLPSFAVVAYDYHPGPLDRPESLMEGLASGVAGSDTGSSVDLSSLATDSAGGVTYRCVRIVGPARGTLCTWQETDVLGVVLALNQAIPQARLLTDTVRTAVES